MGRAETPGVHISDWTNCDKMKNLKFNNRVAHEQDVSEFHKAATYMYHLDYNLLTPSSYNTLYMHFNDVSYTIHRTHTHL